MKTAGFFLVLLLSLSAWGDNVTSKRVVDLGTTKAVVFEETLSPDGHYAMGWTIRPKNKAAKPVDWSTWNPDEADKFLDTYTPYLPDPWYDKCDYELIDCVIDLQGKNLMELPADNPNYPTKNHGYVVAAWGPVGQGTRCVLFENDARFHTDNLWLVAIDFSGMHQTDIAGVLQKAVDPIIEEKRPLVSHDYETVFPLSPQDTTTMPVAFHGSTVSIPFWSYIPKSEEKNTSVEGVLIVKLPEGTLLKVSTSTPRDDPFKDIPELAKADHELNQVYSQLSQKLSSKQRDELKHDQLLWIVQRDTDAASALDTSRDARNKSFLESTQQRTTDLQDRLNALH